MEIKRIRHKGRVHDLTVENTSSYNISGLAVHNSAAGTLLTYLLGITHVDPLKYDLSLERFLTLDRIKGGALPDIDQDLQSRDLLINPEDQSKGWLPERFGDCFATIGTSTRLRLKSSVKDVARARLGFVPDDIEFLAKKFLMPPQGIDDHDFIFGYDGAGERIPGSIESDKALQEYIEKYPRDWEVVQRCLGLERSRSKHASAVLIANRPVNEFIPLQIINKVVTTQYNMGDVEAAGGLKMDFLNVNSLGDIQEAIKLIQARSGLNVPESLFVHGRKVPAIRLVPFGGEFHDIWDLPEEQAVFREICESKTETVFQLATPGALQWLEQFDQWRGDSNERKALDTITAVATFTALNRPGPLDANVEGDGMSHNMLVEYARRARGEKPIGAVPLFDELVPETYGILVFQEQLQKIYQAMTGCSGPEAEEFRRNVAKKKMDKINKAYEPWLENVGSRYGAETAKDTWQKICTFGNYGFNKSVDQDTILNPCGQKPKKIKDFKPGDKILGVNDHGETIETMVVALHDHGVIEGVEVVFDDGHRIVCSENHKFLTERGMVSASEIARLGLLVFCEQDLAVSMRDQFSKSEKTGFSSKRLRNMQGFSESQDGAAHCLKRLSLRREGRFPPSQRPPKNVPQVSSRPLAKTQRVDIHSSMRGSGRSFQKTPRTPRIMRGVQGFKDQKHRPENAKAQSETRAKSCGFKDRHQNVAKTGNPCSKSRAFAEMENSKPGSLRRNSPKIDPLSQKPLKARIDSSGEPSSQLARCSNQMRRKDETSGFRLSGSQNLGRSRRVLALLSGKEGQREALGGSTSETVQRLHAQPGSDSKRRRLSDQDVDAMLFSNKQEAQARTPPVAYSDAPLSNTGSLVSRRVVSYRSVGPRRMYDLEVSHPKHNFLLPNGVVTSNSHAICYTVISYACAFLKHHYPLEWWTAVLRNANKKEISGTFWKYCGDKIDFPEIGSSGDRFDIVGDRIRAPLSLLMGIGPKAHERIMQLRPYNDIEDFCAKLEKYSVENAKPILGEDGKPQFTKPKKGEVAQIRMRRATNPVNKSVAYDLIIAGALDSLFPKEIDLDGTKFPVTDLDKLKMYEIALAKSKGKKKPEAIDPEFEQLTPIKKYQRRRLVLEMYSEPLMGLIAQSSKDVIVKTIAGTKRYHWPHGEGEIPFLTPEAVRVLDEVDLFPEDRVLWGALPAYVVSQKIFWEGKACEFILDVDGVYMRYVKWPERKGPKQGSLDLLYKEDWEGAVVVASISKYKADRPFSLEKLTMISPPISTKKDKKDDDTQQE